MVLDIVLYMLIVRSLFSTLRQNQLYLTHYQFPLKVAVLFFFIWLLKIVLTYSLNNSYCAIEIVKYKINVNDMFIAIATVTEHVTDSQMNPSKTFQSTNKTYMMDIFANPCVQMLTISIGYRLIMAYRPPMATS